MFQHSGSAGATHARGASDGVGGMLACWAAVCAGHYAVLVTRLLASGALANGWTPGGVAVCAVPSTQIEPALAADAPL